VNAICRSLFYSLNFNILFFVNVNSKYNFRIRIATTPFRRYVIASHDNAIRAITVYFMYVPFWTLFLARRCFHVVTIITLGLCRHFQGSLIVVQKNITGQLSSVFERSNGFQSWKSYKPISRSTRPGIVWDTDNREWTFRSFAKNI
jgi:hypothetical protein